MRRILVGAAVVLLGSLASVASPAQAASGPWSVVSAGNNHTCAVNTAKSLYCWGNNNNGQIGDGTAGNQRPSPTKIGTSGAWATVSAGRDHTCAITTGRSLYCWGYNAGQIGDGTTIQRPSPTKIGTSGVWSGVAAGGAHTCATTTGKSLYCWGFNDLGSVGDGTTVTRPSPKKIGTSGLWAGVATGSLHTCAITTGRSLYCWGYNQFGSVGDGTTSVPRLSPKKIGSSGVWASAEAGDVHTCAITTGRSLYCWGYNGSGQIGDGTTTQRPSPRKIGSSGVWARVSAGGDAGSSQTCATTTGNSLYCWGNNAQGQIGDGTTGTNRLLPKKIGSSGVWAGATAGGSHTCAVSTGKSLYCWGYNQFGQVGDGTSTSPRTLPRNIA